MIEDDRRELVVAADQLEALAPRTSGGDWRIGGLLATRPEVIADLACVADQSGSSG